VKRRGSLLRNLSNEDLVINTDTPKAKCSETRPSFVWVCRQLGISRSLVDALGMTDNGECIVSPMFARWVNGFWVGPRWIVRAWGLTEEEANAMQRVAPKLDPSAVWTGWDDKKQDYLIPKKG
jgi:hypothetical protein